MSFVSVNQLDNGVVVVAADRPPANAMDIELLNELVAAIDEVAADPPAAVVLAGREDFFSAGADLKVVPNYGPDEQRGMVEGINAMVLSVYGLPCPVVGAITGHAIAGGLVLALCTDLRVASAAGLYGLTEVKVGIPYPLAAMAVVRAELPPHAARALALGNQLVPASECLRLGVFDEVIGPDLVLSRALELAGELAGMPGDVYARTKQELRGTMVETLRAAAEEDPLLGHWVP
jgi:enoyl-CoA hydratase/carnithine racemase